MARCWRHDGSSAAVAACGVVVMGPVMVSTPFATAGSSRLVAAQHDGGRTLEDAAPLRWMGSTG
jgi:hypothetical protein